MFLVIRLSRVMFRLLQSLHKKPIFYQTEVKTDWKLQLPELCHLTSYALNFRKSN